jgi:hypothetical protein
MDELHHVLLNGE